MQRFQYRAPDHVCGHHTTHTAHCTPHTAHRTPARYKICAELKNFTSPCKLLVLTASPKAPVIYVFHWKKKREEKKSVVGLWCVARVITLQPFKKVRSYVVIRPSLSRGFLTLVLNYVYILKCLWVCTQTLRAPFQALDSTERSDELSYI